MDGEGRVANPLVYVYTYDVPYYNYLSLSHSIVKNSLTY